LRVIVIVRGREDADRAAVAAVMPEHVRAMRALHQHPSVRSIEELAGTPGVLLTLECPTPGEAEVLVRELPMVSLGFASWEALGVKPYAAWEVLFDEHA